MPSAAFHSPGWVDVALGSAVLLSILVGLWRGFVFEVLSLAGWVVAFVAAQVWGDEVSALIPFGVQGSALNHGISIAVTFFAALIAWGLMSRVVRMLIRATPLSGVDRVLGAGFGVLRGGVLLLIVATVVLMTPAARSPLWQRSIIAPWASAGLQGLRSMLPHAVVRHLPPEVGTRVQLLPFVQVVGAARRDAGGAVQQQGPSCAASLA